MTNTSPQPPSPPQDFRGLGLTPQILSILETAGFTHPTPIQARAIPIAITGKDIIGIAQTGTGKTLAFGVPLIQRLIAAQHERGLIVVPTRELALQVEASLAKVGRPLGIRAVVLIGGAPMGRQIANLRTNPPIVIGTPGRIIDHLERNTLTLDRMTTVVLDEADRMLDLGFSKQIQRILDVLPRQRQTLLFSATMPDDIVRIAQRYMELPLRVEIAPAGTMAEAVTQELFLVTKDQKFSLLERLLHEYQGSILVFSRTKHGAKKLNRFLRDRGQKAAEIHGNRSLAQRQEALGGFKTGRYRVLVATDIAARGIDVTGIELVLNYDIPEHAEDYVHRIGRTGRAGQTGHAITFVQPDQRGKVRDIERLVRASLQFAALPEGLASSAQPFMAAHTENRPTQPPRPMHDSWSGQSAQSRPGQGGPHQRFRRRRRPPGGFQSSGQHPHGNFPPRRSPDSSH